MGIRRAHGLVLFVALLSACDHDAGPITLTLARTRTDAAAPATVRVSGLSSKEIAALRDVTLSDAGWQSLLRVTVAGAPADGPPVSGRYAVTDEGVEFTPLFPFDAGRPYALTFDPAKMPVPRAGSIVMTTASLPAVAHPATTTVVRMLPTSDRLPGNLLRVYLEFSAPMSRENGRDFLRLFDERGQPVPDAFLALDVDFWSPDHRRYTVFFDPGRVKRGILPNDQLGRALVSGRRYTLEVDPRWRDENGQPLAATFRRTFEVTPPDLSPIRLDHWHVQSPDVGTRAALVVTFPKPLDHGLLQRTIGVARHSGDAVIGEITIGAEEREWRFTPRDPWVSGSYDLVVSTILEDPQGNRIGRSFDIDTFEHQDQPLQTERLALPSLMLPFVVR